jgi:hypothetical protein
MSKSLEIKIEKGTYVLIDLSSYKIKDLDRSKSRLINRNRMYLPLGLSIYQTPHAMTLKEIGEDLQKQEILK